MVWGCISAPACEITAIKFWSVMPLYDSTAQVKRVKQQVKGERMHA